MTLPVHAADREYQVFVEDRNGDTSFRTLSEVVQGFNIPVFDDIVLGYTGDDLTSVVYKKDSVVVATLTLSYTGDKLTGVTKS